MIPKREDVRFSDAQLPESNITWLHVIDRVDIPYGPAVYNDVDHANYILDFIECYNEFKLFSNKDISFEMLDSINKSILKGLSKRNSSFLDENRMKGIARFGLVFGVNCSIDGLKEIEKFADKFLSAIPRIGEFSSVEAKQYIRKEKSNSFPGWINHKRLSIDRTPLKVGYTIGLLERNSTEEELKGYVKGALNEYNQTMKSIGKFSYKNDLDKFDQFLDALTKLASTLERLHPFADANCRTCVMMVIYLECNKLNIPCPYLRNPNEFDGMSHSELKIQLIAGVRLSETVGEMSHLGALEQYDRFVACISDFHFEKLILEKKSNADYMPSRLMSHQIIIYFLQKSTKETKDKKFNAMKKLEIIATDPSQSHEPKTIFLLAIRILSDMSWTPGMFVNSVMGANNDRSYTTNQNIIGDTAELLGVTPDEISATLESFGSRAPDPAQDVQTYANLGL